MRGRGPSSNRLPRLTFAAAARSALRNWYLLLICAAAAGSSAWFLLHRETPRYQSTQRLAVGPSPALPRSTLIAETVDALNKRSLILTFAEIAGGRRIYDDAANEAGLPKRARPRYQSTSVAMPNANVILLAVRGPDRLTTAAISARLGTAAASAIDAFDRNVSVRILDRPQTPAGPVSPRPKRDVPLAAVGGLLLGLALGLIRDGVGRRH